MHALVRTLALTVGAAVATVGLAPAAGAASSETPDPFAGDRRVILVPTGSEGALGLDRGLRATYSEGFGRRSMFVLTRVHGERYWLRTAEITRGGEPQCLQLGRRGVVRAAPCDAAERSQLFRLRESGRASSRPTYLLHTHRQRHLVQRPDGGFASQRVGEGTDDVETPFVLLDRGPASLPAQD